MTSDVQDASRGDRRWKADIFVLVSLQENTPIPNVNIWAVYIFLMQEALKWNYKQLTAWSFTILTVIQGSVQLVLIFHFTYCYSKCPKNCTNICVCVSYCKKNCVYLLIRLLNYLRCTLRRFRNTNCLYLMGRNPIEKWSGKDLNKSGGGIIHATSPEYDLIDWGKPRRVPASLPGVLV